MVVVEMMRDIDGDDEGYGDMTDTIDMTDMTDTIDTTDTTDMMI